MFDIVILLVDTLSVFTVDGEAFLMTTNHPFLLELIGLTLYEFFIFVLFALSSLILL